jgi:SAM domain (Sterile alpha motif)
MVHTPAWLEELGLGQYAEAFAEQAIDFEIVAALNDARKLGIPHWLGSSGACNEMSEVRPRKHC